MTSTTTHEKTWDLTTTRSEEGIKVVSPKGSFFVKKNDAGKYEVAGEVVLGTTDNRPLDKKTLPAEFAKKTASPMSGVLGKFEAVKDKLAEAVLVGKEKIAVIPARVKFASINDESAETARDKKFLAEQIEKFCAANPEAVVKQDEEFYNKMMTFVAKKVVADKRVLTAAPAAPAAPKVVPAAVAAQAAKATAQLRAGK